MKTIILNIILMLIITSYFLWSRLSNSFKDVIRYQILRYRQIWFYKFLRFLVEIMIISITIWLIILVTPSIHLDSSISLNELILNTSQIDSTSLLVDQVIATYSTSTIISSILFSSTWYYLHRLSICKCSRGWKITPLKKGSTYEVNRSGRLKNVLDLLSPRKKYETYVSKT